MRSKGGEERAEWGNWMVPRADPPLGFVPDGLEHFDLFSQISIKLLQSFGIQRSSLDFGVAVEPQFVWDRINSVESSPDKAHPLCLCLGHDVIQSEGRCS